MPFLFDSITVGENSIFSIEFYKKNIKYYYEVELNEHSIIREQLNYFNPNKSLVFKRTTDVLKQLTTINFGSKIGVKKVHKEILEANTLWNNTVFGGFLKTNFESFQMQEVLDWFKNNLKPIVVPRTELASYVSEKIEDNEIDKNTVLNILKKADFNISDIEIKREEQNVTDELMNFVSKNMNISYHDLMDLKAKGKIQGIEILFQHETESGIPLELPFGLESQGTQRYYEFGGLLDLMIRNSAVFSIDEFESSLHPDLLKHFLLSFLVNSKQSQLIATTHLRELLMEQDIFRKDAIWFTEKKEDGSTDLFSLDDFDTSVIRKNSSIYNAYKAGKLGATPNLSDYYLDIDYGEE
ncbi:AAA family ATPase [Marinifilum fragile]|uniref:AAA family ATPase n=1 Tax=Marinifilum fragile TaxID=570161 RepID=UPI0021D2EB3B|nr:ATP-binding protein [Marinifilum fragile]